MKHIKKDGNLREKNVYWTLDEEKRLIAALKLFGKNYPALAEAVGGNQNIEKIRGHCFSLNR